MTIDPVVAAYCVALALVGALVGRLIFFKGRPALLTAGDLEMLVAAIFSLALAGLIGHVLDR